jgi:hypothetical protein
MSPRRPSVIGSLTAPPQGGAPEAAKPKPKASASDVVHTSLYVPRPAYRKLQEIAFTQDRKVHDLILDGIDRVLAEHGHAPTERRKRGPKSAL